MGLPNHFRTLDTQWESQPSQQLQFLVAAKRAEEDPSLLKPQRVPAWLCPKQEGPAQQPTASPAQTFPSFFQQIVHFKKPLLQELTRQGRHSTLTASFLSPYAHFKTEKLRCAAVKASVDQPNPGQEQVVSPALCNWCPPGNAISSRSHFTEHCLWSGLSLVEQENQVRSSLLTLADVCTPCSCRYIMASEIFTLIESAANSKLKGPPRRSASWVRAS